MAGLPTRPVVIFLSSGSSSRNGRKGRDISRLLSTDTLGLPTKPKLKSIRAVMNLIGEKRFLEIPIAVTLRPLNSVCRIRMNNAENLPIARFTYHKYMR
jgi:hypothetical protein